MFPEFTFPDFPSSEPSAAPSSSHGRRNRPRHRRASSSQRPSSEQTPHESSVDGQDSHDQAPRRSDRPARAPSKPAFPKRSRPDDRKREGSSQKDRPSRGDRPSSRDKGGPKYFDKFFTVEKHSPGSSYIAPATSKGKKNFPFTTPTQALRKHLGGPKNEAKPTPIADGVLRVILFGGAEQVGLNCVGFEYDNELLIVDMGLQFADQYQFGINSSIPDLTYTRSKKVVGVAITHGHIDHIGAVPYIMPYLDKNVPLYATPMAYELIKMKQEENRAPINNMVHLERNKTIQISKYFSILPFTVDHSIPDSVGLCIETPVGRFVHTGDWKFDKNPLPHRPSTDYNLLQSLGDLGIRALLSDSTNAHLAGSSISESEVIHSIEEIFAASSGRVITATFSSIIDRVMVIISAAEKFNRKVVLLGRGMNNYMDIAIKLGYAQPKPGTLITMQEADRLPDEQVTICCTGAQGERYAALMRIATGESHDTCLKSTDTVVFSSSVIPGNERSVQGLFDIIAQQGPRVYQYKESEIHAGGHARAEDTKKMISLLRPQIYVPIYGFPHMLHGNAKNARSLGYTDDNIVIPCNGMIIEFTKDEHQIAPYSAPHRLITVDGRMIGHTKENTLHERNQLGTNGVVMISIAKKAGKYVINMDSVGMPDVREIGQLAKKIEVTLTSILEQEMSRFESAEHFRKYAIRTIGDIIFEETGKEPIVVVTTH